MSKEFEIFCMAKVCMDTFKSKYDKAKAKKEKSLEDLNKNFRPGSPLFIEERDKIAPMFKKEIETARNEALAAFEDALEKTIARERGHAMVISSSIKDMLNALNCIENNPISLDEYQCLVQSFGNKSYWIDRKLETIASKNSIYETGIQPSLSTKLEVLDELAENTRQFFNEYDGEKKTFLITSSDKYIFGLEERYTNSYSGVRMSDRETAKRLVDEALNSRDSLERSVTLANALKTSKPELQDEILTLLAENDYIALSDPTMRFIGVKKIVDKFKKENLQDIKAADAAIEKINNAKSYKERMSVIYDNISNKYFGKKIAATNDEKLKDSYETALEVKRQKESQQGAARRE